MLKLSPLTAWLHALHFSVLLGFASAALAATEPAEGPREIIPFDTDWRFQLGDDATTKQPDFDDTKWRALDVPHDWSIEAPVSRPPKGERNGGVSITTPKITPKQAIVEARHIIDAHFFSAEEQQAWLKDEWKAQPTNREVVLRSSVLALDGTVVASTESKLKLENMHPGQHTTQRVVVPKT
jgi:hypothetical protein